MSDQQNDPYAGLQDRLAKTTDEARAEAVAKRHARGGRTARENLADLTDGGSVSEYGQLAVAAQRTRREGDALYADTAADAVITAVGNVNAALFSSEQSRTALIINDYSVLAGTQGYFHHRKIDRMLDVAERDRLPIVMYTEGGGGRPGDTDVLVSMAGLNVPTFHRWAALAGRVPRIAVNHGYCFAGNAALFGAADLRIATEASCIGMAGPAMIEGGGLGRGNRRTLVRSRCIAKTAWWILSSPTRLRRPRSPNECSPVCRVRCRIGRPPISQSWPR